MRVPQRLLFALVLCRAAAVHAQDGGVDAQVGSVTVSPEADPIHFKTGALAGTEQGKIFYLPAGYYLPDLAWDKVSIEFERLQNVETRLGAENKSLRETNAARPWSMVKVVGWSMLAGAAATALGFWALR